MFTSDYSIETLGDDSSLESITSNIRLYYVLDGRLKIKIGDKTFILENKEIVMANSLEKVEILEPKDFLLVQISLDYYKLCKLTDRNSIRLNNSSKIVVGADYTKLSSLIQQLLLENLSYEENKLVKGYIYYYQIVDMLLGKYFEAREFGKTENENAEKILQYIHANYLEDISLGEIAEELHISLSTASRMLSSKTGVNFAKYLKNLRLKHVEKLLNETDLSITRIAIESGFSSHSHLNRVFKEDYGCTPTEYRERIAVKREEEQSNAKNNKQDLARKILIESINNIKEGRDNIQTINADVSSCENISYNNSKLLNVGPAYVMNSALMQNHILFLKEQLDIEYIRIWNIFSERMMVDNNTDYYNFSFIDEIMDFCVKNELKLYFDLAQRKEVALATEKVTIFENDTNREYTKETWADMLTSFILHIRKRYGAKIVEKWIFEFSFFLNDRPYYIADRYNSTEVWNTGYSIIKKLLPNAKIAGPGIIASENINYIELVLEGFFKVQNYPDIFTSINFPYYRQVAGISSSAYDGEIKKTARRDYIARQITNIKKVLENYNFRGKYWITDWGNSLGSRNYIQDSCFRAANIIENEIANMDKVDNMGIFYASDSLNSYTDTSQILFGGAGIVSRNGISKPAFFAYQFLNYLGKKIIKRDENCIVSMDDENNLHIICFSNNTLSPKYYLSEENIHKPEDIEQLFSNLDKQNLSIILNNLQNGNYTVREKYVSTEHGSILDEWIELNCPENITIDDMEYLKQSVIPRLTLNKRKVVNGQLKIDVTLSPNEIRYIEVSIE